MIKTTTKKNPLGEWNQNRLQKSSAIREHNRFITQVQGDTKYLTYFWVPHNFLRVLKAEILYPQI